MVEVPGWLLTLCTVPHAPKATKQVKRVVSNRMGPGYLWVLDLVSEEVPLPEVPEALPVYSYTEGMRGMPESKYGSLPPYMPWVVMIPLKMGLPEAGMYPPVLVW